MEAQTTLVRANSAVELYTITKVGLNLTLVVNPGYTESEDALGLNHALNNLCFLKLRMLVINLLDRLKDFTYSLQILGFAWVFSLQVGHDFLNVHDNNTKMLLIR